MRRSSFPADLAKITPEHQRELPFRPNLTICTKGRIFLRAGGRFRTYTARTRRRPPPRSSRCGTVAPQADVGTCMWHRRGPLRCYTQTAAGTHGRLHAASAMKMHVSTQPERRVNLLIIPCHCLNQNEQDGWSAKRWADACGGPYSCPVHMVSDQCPRSHSDKHHCADTGARNHERESERERERE